MLKHGATALCAVATFAFSTISAHSQDPPRATIVDTAETTQPHAKMLADLGVTVIGRYYGRCPQWKTTKRDKRIVENKRMIDNAGEVDAILADGRLAILSIYQFYSQESKFDKDRASGPVGLVDD